MNKICQKTNKIIAGIVLHENDLCEGPENLLSKEGLFKDISVVYRKPGLLEICHFLVRDIKTAINLF